MKRAALLAVAVLCCLGQAGDGQPRARASVCYDKQCNKSGASGFAPALVRVTYSVPIRAENRAAQFGLFCDDYEQQSAWSVDGDTEKIPSWLVTYRDVPAGTCHALLRVWRADGSQQRAESNRVVIQGND